MNEGLKSTPQAKKKKRRIREKKSHKRAMIITALIMIFNPNIAIIDLLPDFIGFFLLSRAFTRERDASPFFDEAAVCFNRAMWITLLKIPAFMLMLKVRGENTLDNDIVVLLSFVFAVAELLVLVPAVKNMFSALFYLGERTDALALIGGGNNHYCDALRSFTYIFVVSKSLLFMLPEFLRLTRTVDYGAHQYMKTGSLLYPRVVLIALILGFIIGGIWLGKMIRYINRIHRQGKFDEAIKAMIGELGAEEYSRKQIMQRKSRGYLWLTLAALCSFELIFKNYNNINMLPHFVMGIFIFGGTLILSHFVNQSPVRTIARLAPFPFIASSVLAYSYSLKFFKLYEYADLYKALNPAAKEMYSNLTRLYALELICFIFMIGSFYMLMRKYILENFGKPPSAPDYLRHDRRYHNKLLTRTLALALIALFGGIAKFVNVLFQGNVKMIFVTGDELYSGVIYSPSVPWFNLVVIGTSILYFLYSIYFFGMLKEESQTE